MTEKPVPPEPTPPKGPEPAAQRAVQLPPEEHKVDLKLSNAELSTLNARDRPEAKAAKQRLAHSTEADAELMQALLAHREESLLLRQHEIRSQFESIESRSDSESRASREQLRNQLSLVMNELRTIGSIIDQVKTGSPAAIERAKAYLAPEPYDEPGIADPTPRPDPVESSLTAKQLTAFLLQRDHTIRRLTDAYEARRQARVNGAPQFPSDDEEALDREVEGYSRHPAVQLLDEIQGALAIIDRLPRPLSEDWRVYRAALYELRVRLLEDGYQTKVKALAHAFAAQPKLSEVVDESAAVQLRREAERQRPDSFVRLIQAAEMGWFIQPDEQSERATARTKLTERLAQEFEIEWTTFVRFATELHDRYRTKIEDLDWSDPERTLDALEVLDQQWGNDSAASSREAGFEPTLAQWVGRRPSLGGQFDYAERARRAEELLGLPPATVPAWVEHLQPEPRAEPPAPGEPPRSPAERQRLRAELTALEARRTERDRTIAELSESIRQLNDQIARLKPLIERTAGITRGVAPAGRSGRERLPAGGGDGVEEAGVVQSPFRPDTPLEASRPAEPAEPTSEPHPELPTLEETKQALVREVEATLAQWLALAQQHEQALTTINPQLLMTSLDAARRDELETGLIAHRDGLQALANSLSTLSIELGPRPGGKSKLDIYPTYRTLMAMLDRRQVTASQEGYLPEPLRNALTAYHHAREQER